MNALKMQDVFNLPEITSPVESRTKFWTGKADLYCAWTGPSFQIVSFF